MKRLNGVRACRRTRIHAYTLGVTLGVGCGTGVFAQPTIQGLGQVAGLGTPLAQAISADGSTIVGRVQRLSGSSINEGVFRFRGGIETFSSAFGDPSTYAPAVNRDGNIITGYTGGGANNRAFRWALGSMPQQILPAAGEDGAIAVTISGDGNTIAGASYGPGHGYHAFRWTVGDGREDLGAASGSTQSLPFGMSADGKVIVGQTQDGLMSGQAYKWTRSGGMETLTNPVGSIGGVAAAASADGGVIVGTGYDTSGNSRGVAWRGGETPIALLRPAWAVSVSADGIDASGNVAVGYATGEMAGQAISRAMIWSDSLGGVGAGRDLNEFLAAQGLNLAGWTLEYAYGISGDGMRIVGTGQHNGHLESWIVTVPGPGAGALAAGLTWVFVGRRRRMV